MNELSEFLRAYGTLILASLGFIQLWAIEAWKRFGRQGEVEIYETGNIEISYNFIGPTIGMNGTLRALNKDVFIRSIDLTIVREKDRAQHVFRWYAIRPPKIDLVGTSPVSWDIPSGFLLSPSKAHQFNITFNDNDLMDEFRPLFETYYSEWYKVLEQLHTVCPPGALPSPADNAQRTLLIESFERSQFHVGLYTTLDRKCYWEPGRYRLSVNVKTSKPDKGFSNNHRFTINDEDFRKLKLNVITMLRAPICSYLNVPNFLYYSAYSPYEQ